MSVAIRPSTPSDRPAVLPLLSASLGMRVDETFERFFEWKHEQNPFGASPAWVAVDGDRVVGFRTFLRWEFDGPEAGSGRRAVRAVDTATHPEYQGQGIFRQLTLRGLDELARDGVAFVFNTPNAKSRPGYLSMGWTEIGRLPVSARVTSALGPLRMLRSRGAAERWSADAGAADAAPAVLADASLEELLAALPSPAGLRTPRRAEVIRWRYGFEPLGYRAVALGGDVRRGVALFRVRRRLSAREAALCDVLVPAGDERARTALERLVAKTARADYVIRIGGAPVDRAGYIRVPRQGPVLTYRPVTATRATTPSLAAWELSLGDIELF